MASDRRALQQMRDMCGEIHEDDGVDPREFFKAGSGPRTRNYKAKQLCRQAAQTLDQVLSGETSDPRLACLRVLSVQPAPDTSRLLVTVMADCPAEDFLRDETEARLAVATGRLRTAVTAAINRRKAPALIFALLGPQLKEARNG